MLIILDNFIQVSSFYLSHKRFLCAVNHLVKLNSCHIISVDYDDNLLIFWRFTQVSVL